MKKYFVPLGLKSGVDYEFYQYFTPMGQIYVHIFCVISSLAKIFSFQFGEELLFVSVMSKPGFDSVFFFSRCLAKILSLHQYMY
jgi:hypothetical protein